MISVLIRILFLVVLPIILFGKEPYGFLNTNVVPDAHFVYQRSLGPTASIGLNYLKEKKLITLDPYCSVDLGGYGQAYNAGMRLGKGGLEGALVNVKVGYSYLQVSQGKGLFKEGNYHGVAIEIHILLLSQIRVGFYIGEKKDPNINVGIGIGWY